ncbi:MAG: hypothetical protein IJD28_02010 [Deferribacterales bacterium]|nr:hypothetical protein [Deferribacterales bacterium]
MMDTIVVVLVVAVAAAVIGLKFYRTLSGKGGCSCACNAGNKNGGSSCCSSNQICKD